MPIYYNPLCTEIIKGSRL